MKLLFTFIFLLSISTVFAQSVTVAPNKVVSTQLSGSGERAVYADSLGKLTALRRTYTVNVSPQDFKKRNSSTSSTFVASGSYSDCYILGTNATDILVAPVSVPVGATITKFQVYFTDNDPVNNLSFILTQVQLTSTGSSTVASLGQNTTNANPFNISTLMSDTLNNLATEDKIYRILVSPFATSGVGIWNYDGVNSNYMSIKGVKITYVL